YGLYFALAALTLWLWIHTNDESSFSAFVFGTAFFVAFLVHYYSVLCLVPYAAALILDRAEWRARFGKFAAGCVGVACAAALTHGPILAARQISSIFWSPASLQKLADVYVDFFPRGALLLALIMLWIVLTVREGENRIFLPPMSRAE